MLPGYTRFKVCIMYIATFLLSLITDVACRMYVYDMLYQGLLQLQYTVPRLAAASCGYTKVSCGCTKVSCGYTKVSCGYTKVIAAAISMIAAALPRLAVAIPRLATAIPRLHSY